MDSDDFELEELDNFKEEYIMDIEHELIQPQPQQRVIILDQVVTKKQDIIVPSTSAVHTKQTKTLPTKDQSLIPTLPSSIVIKKIYPSVVHKKIPVASMLTKKLVTKPPCKNLVPFVRNGFVQIFGKRSEHIYSFIEIIEADKFLYYSGIKKNKFEDLLDKILTYFGKEHCVPYISNNDQLLLTLMMYRFKFDAHLVSKTFRLDKATAIKIFYYWTSILTKYLKSIPFWKLLEYSKCTLKLYVLQVCTVNVTQNKQFQLVAEPNESFIGSSKIEPSSDKLKYLVALSDMGHVLFCSDAMSGTYNDNNVIRGSRVVEKFSDNDTVLSSAEMYIDDLLEIQGVTIQTTLSMATEDSNEETIIQATQKISKTLRYPLLTMPSYLLPIADDIIYTMNVISSFKSVVMKCCT